MQRRIDAKLVKPLISEKLEPLSYATDGSAAMDLRACIEEAITIEPKERKLIGTGIAINIQDPGLVAIVASRSGLSLKHGVCVAQGIGVIDADYQGEIGVILENNGTENFTVLPGDRIAQLLFQPVVQVSLNYVQDFAESTERGAGGFGSTGKS